VAFGGVGRTCDGCSFGSVLGELLDEFCCFPDLDPADRMLSGYDLASTSFQISYSVGVADCVNWLAVC